MLQTKVTQGSLRWPEETTGQGAHTTLNKNRTLRNYNKFTKYYKLINDKGIITLI